jgi:hypothetical protein
MMTGKVGKIIFTMLEIKEENRNPIVEALVTNFRTQTTEKSKQGHFQYMLFEPSSKYTSV